MGKTEAEDVANRSPLSAERLRAAFERMLQPGESDHDESKADAVTPAGILEALLYSRASTDGPLTLAEASELVQGVDPDQLRDCIARLNAEYEASDSALRIRVSGEKAELCVASGLEHLRQRLAKSPRPSTLTKKSLELLAVIAYRQPLGADQVEALVGEDCSKRLRLLQRHGLVELTAAKDESDSPKYVTTERFLSVTGIETADSLPPEREFSN